MEAKGRIYTVLKIDEVSNLGAAKIRIRSLVQASTKEDKGFTPADRDEIQAPKKAVYTKEMKEDGYTILVPAMAPDHFKILKGALSSEGYNFEFLEKVDTKVIDAGLKYVNNDSCYPSITVVGQMMEALE